MSIMIKYGATSNNSGIDGKKGQQSSLAGPKGGASIQGGERTAKHK